MTTMGQHEKTVELRMLMQAHGDDNPDQSLMYTFIIPIGGLVV